MVFGLLTVAQAECDCREAEAASLGLDTSKQTEDALSVHAPLAVAAWKGKGSINILVSKGIALSTLL